MKFLLKILILNFFFISSVISAELNCETFSGTWEGNKKGAGYKGDLKIVFDDNCKYDIFKKNGKIHTLAIITKLLWKKINKDIINY